MRYRKIMCNDPQEGVSYRLSNPVTGEIRETGDLATILKCIAEDDSMARHFGGNLEFKFERIAEVSESEVDPGVEYGDDEFGDEEHT